RIEGLNKNPQDPHSQCVRTGPDGNLYFVPEQNGRPISFDREQGGTEIKKLGDTDVEVQKRGDYYVGADNTIYTRDGERNNIELYKDSQVYVRSDPHTGDLTYYKGKPEGDSASPLRGPDRLKGRPVPDYLIRAPDSFFNSLRCVCLPAITSYLQQIRNILAAIRQCFQGVLVTK